MTTADAPILECFEDPAAFLDQAGEYLARDPLVNTVVVGVTRRMAADDAAGVIPSPDIPRWWMLTRAPAGETPGGVRGVVMRTARAAPYPLYVLPMPDQDAVAVARALVDRGELVDSVNGALPAARVLADELARLGGGTVRVHLHSRLFSLTTLRPPDRRPPGRLRPATPGEGELVLGWFIDFLDAADEQAGRPRGSSGGGGHHTLTEIVGRIEAGTVWLWCDPTGQPVHVTAAGEPGYGVSRIGPVYTPPEHRGRGYATAAVAEVSARLLEQGVRPCLFTDLANPTSNQIYQTLGYHAVVDSVALEVDPAEP